MSGLIISRSNCASTRNTNLQRDGIESVKEKESGGVGVGSSPEQGRKAMASSCVRLTISLWEKWEKERARESRAQAFTVH